MTNQQIAAAVLEHDPNAQDIALVVANWLMSILEPDDIEPLTCLGPEAVDTIAASLRAVRDAELERVAKTAMEATFDLSSEDRAAFACV
ncbi:MAG: hypothetical protein HN802_02505 [Candidatus Jacksonbacteria bacterium]|jgi:hypothetical protein|nr:hypothetical protein [Candidatus Jacksonbacteria bacterium]